MSENLMDKIVSLCKRRGFIFQSSEIYGGLGSVWDYGPLGVELKNNVKKVWWSSIVYQRNDMVGLDAGILMHPKVWEASGHTKNFTDPLIDCKKCKGRFRESELNPIHQHIKKKLLKEASKINDPDFDKLLKGYLEFKQIGICPKCGAEVSIVEIDILRNLGIEITLPRMFNLMLKTFLGPVEDAASLTYLRPETAQGIFVNFLNILDVSRKKLPFGVAQIGKAFRNEITPGNFTFRTREFEQMEIEYFVNPKDADNCYKDWVNERFDWYLKFGIKKENLRKREHKKDELAHYAASCTDIEYNFPFGWSELEGIANRTDFDLKQHSEFSGKELKYFNEQTKEKYFPYIIEPSGGVDRTVLAFLVDAYNEEEVHPALPKDNEFNTERKSGVKGETRVVLKFYKDLAPVKIAVFPLLKNRPQLVELAKKINAGLKNKFICMYDDTAAIGKLYRRQDEVGTPYCVTVDVQSLEDKKVTVRERDTMLQDRVSIDKLEEYLVEKLK